jgi:predicted porin
MKHLYFVMNENKNVLDKKMETRMKAIQSELLTLAVSVACGMPFAACAQEDTDVQPQDIPSSSVRVYGKLYPEITSYHLNGGTRAGAPLSTLVRPQTATSTSVTSMEASNTYIGFRGEENLGNGVAAIYQMEGGFNIDDGTQAKPGILFNRDTFVGLRGRYGTLKLGANMDTPYKRLYDQIGFFGVSTGNFPSASNILAQGGFGTSNAERFHERPANTILYESPIINGFQGLFSYSFGEVPGSFPSKSLISSGIKYEVGPIYIGLGHEEHVGLYGGSSNLFTALGNGTYSGSTFTPADGTTSRDKSTRLTAKYSFPTQTRVEIDVATTKLNEDGGAFGHFQSYKHNSWLLSADQQFGAWTLAAAYGSSGEGSCVLVGGVACNTGGLDATMASLGASYSLSKRTLLFALLTNLHNGYSANFDNTSTIAPKSVAPGQDLTEVAMGISVRF